MELQKIKKKNQQITQQLKKAARLDNQVNPPDVCRTVFLKECQENHIIRMRKHYVSQSSIKVKPWEKVKNKIIVPSKYRLEKPIQTKSYQRFNNSQNQVVTNRLNRNFSQNVFQNRQKYIAPPGILKKKNSAPVKQNIKTNQTFTRSILKGCTQMQDRNNEIINSIIVNSIRSNYISDTKNCIESSNRIITQNTKIVNVDIPKTIVQRFSRENLEPLFRRTDELYKSLNEIVHRMGLEDNNNKITSQICKSLDSGLEKNKGISLQIRSKEDIRQLFKTPNNKMPVMNNSSNRFGYTDVKSTDDSSETDESDEDIQNNEIQYNKSSNIVNIQPIRSYLAGSSVSNQFTNDNESSETNIAKINSYKAMLSHYYNQDLVFKETKSVGCFPSRLTPMNQPFLPIKAPCLLGINKFMKNNPHFSNQNYSTANMLPQITNTGENNSKMYNTNNPNLHPNSMKSSRDARNSQGFDYTFVDESAKDYSRE